ncbi:MAG: hypothetical protein F6K62_06395 [Sphaerospermopsis sp. SIO1G2]|nr:hypothetical protein [Sphaerospermopsis sp. SIO1G2]
MTISPLFLFPTTAEAKCLNYWINPLTGRKECLKVNSGYSRRNRQINHDVEVIDDSGSGEKKFRIQPTRCGGYRVRLVDKNQKISRRLNTYWLGNRSHFSVLNSERVFKSPKIKYSPSYSSRNSRRKQRKVYQNHNNFQTKVKSGFNGNYQRSGVGNFRRCQNYYQHLK